MPTPVRAAIYLRVSLDLNMDGLAIDRQRQDCLEIAKKRGWVITEEYVDQSKSATDKTKKRPAYDRMVADFQAGHFSAIICWDLDRLTRQPRQLEDWIDAAEDNGLLLVTANGEADLATDGGRMYARIKAAVARAEVERKAVRQSRAQQQRAQQGRPPKGTRALGYTTDGTVIPEEATVVTEMFRLFSIPSGTPIAAIAAALSGKHGADVPASLPHLPKFRRTLVQERNARRVANGQEPRPVPDDGPWTSSTVLGILRNPRYAGFSVYTDRKDRAKNKRRSWYAQIARDDNGVPVKGQWEPIVEELTWLTVQERLNDQTRLTNRTGATTRKHLGSSLYRCGVCDKPMTAHSRGYRCSEGGHVMRSREHVDAFVREVIRQRLALPDLDSVLPVRDEPRLHEIAVAVTEHQARIKRVEHDYEAGHLEAADLKRVRDRARAAIADLELERIQISVGTELNGIVAAQDPVQAFDDADLAVQRRVIDLFCTVRLLHHPRGRKQFDPATVAITPK